MTPEDWTNSSEESRESIRDEWPLQAEARRDELVDFAVDLLAVGCPVAIDLWIEITVSPTFSRHVQVSA